MKLAKLKEQISDVRKQLQSYPEKENWETDADLQAEAREKADLLGRLEIEKVAEEAAEAERRDAALISDAGEQKEIRENFSLLSFAKKVATGTLDGFEKEMHQEAIDEFKEATGGAATFKQSEFAIPRKVLLTPGAFNLQQRKSDVLVGTPTAGGHAVNEEDGGFISKLRQELMLTQLGARFLTGLIGNLDYSYSNAVASFAWAAEQGAATEQVPTFGERQLTPKRGAGYINISDQWYAQTSQDVHNDVDMQLIHAVQEGIETAAFNGGLTNGPVGIIQTTGIGDVPGGVNGDAPDWPDIVNLVRELKVNNLRPENVAYVTTPEVEAYLKQTLKSAGVGGYIWNDVTPDRPLNGKPAMVTNLMPKTLSKGTSNNILHAILAGDFSHLVIGQWGGVTLKVDDLTQALNATTRLIVNVFVDTLATRPEAFAAKKDCLLP